MPRLSSTKLKPIGIREFKVGMKVYMKSPHVCGSNSFTVSRVGADIGFICDKCGQKILLNRVKAATRAFKRVEE
jgi:hypothetical protein